MKKIDIKIYLYDYFLINNNSHNYGFLKDTFLEMNFYSFSLESELIK
jgi:hypothetical protein